MLGTRRDDHATPSWSTAAGLASSPPRFASVLSNFSEESFHPPPTLLPNSLKPLPPPQVRRAWTSAAATAAAEAVHGSDDGAIRPSVRLRSVCTSLHLPLHPSV